MSADLAVTGSEIVQMIQLADLADSTKVKYTRAIERYLATGASLTDAGALGRYAQGLSQSGRAFLKSAVRLWADYLATRVKGLSTPETVDAVQATLHRLEALNEAIQVKTGKGAKVHTWLSQAEARRLFATCDVSTIAGRRDKLVLGLLAGAGLRREELVNLKWTAVKLLPVKDRLRTVLAIEGKGKRSRTVPLKDSLANALDTWAAVVGKDGLVIRSLGTKREPGERISAVGVFHIVRKAGAKMGKPDLAPHDLRRTFAQLAYEAGIPITQISVLLGHSSVATTQRYLNLELDLEVTASDFVPFG